MSRIYLYENLSVQRFLKFKNKNENEKKKKKKSAEKFCCLLIFAHNMSVGSRSNRLADAVLTSTHNLCFEQK